MRQAGVLAAAARIALKNVERLADDHALARRLAELIDDRWPGSLAAVPATNMVLVNGPALPGGPEKLRLALLAQGIKVGYIRPGVLRFVTHCDVDDGDVDRVARVISSPQ